MSSGEKPGRWQDEYPGLAPWVGGKRAMSQVDAIRLVLDVLRANNLHQDHCQWRRMTEAQRKTDMMFVIPPCDCWLAEES